MSATTDVIISRKTFADTIEGLCRHFDIDLEFFEERNAFGEGLPTSAANADIKKRHITTPYPETASSFAIALHEIGEVTMADLHRKGEPRSWQELRATKFARGCARHLGFDDDVLEAVDFRLGRALASYLAHDLEEGEITRDEIAACVPSELLPYAERLGVQIEREFVMEPWASGVWGPPV